VLQGTRACKLGRVTDDAALVWNERYSDSDATPERGPAQWLVDNVDLLPSRGRVLDLAMGTGRNGLFLAERGHEVVGIDVSTVAAQRCQAEAARRGVKMEMIIASLETFAIPPDAFDVILNFYYLQRDLIPAMSAALRPRGFLIFETFTNEQRQFQWGPASEDHLLKPSELRTLFSELHTLAYREEVVERESERGSKAIASLVARKG
jgi:tellurite methyltransferase